MMKKEVKDQTQTSPTANFWVEDESELLAKLEVTRQGLTSSEAEKRTEEYGANVLSASTKKSGLEVFINQFKSPIIIILLFATVISIILHDYMDSIIILLIVLASGILSFIQEYNAGNAVEKLLDIVMTKAEVSRDGKVTEIPLSEIVPGDIIHLKAGDIIPADSYLLEGNGLSTNESTLTGETFPVDKKVGTFDLATPLSQRSNALWMGTHVVSGDGLAVAVHTGKATEFGIISKRLKGAPKLTDFEIGVRRFGYLLMDITVVMLLGILTMNLLLQKPVLDSLLFSLALAVGLTPQLLPAIISVNLAHGAKRMATEQVIVKKLSAIENFGSMDTLCTDKTGTITTGVIELNSILDISGQEAPELAKYVYLNASLQSGYSNPIDDAIMKLPNIDVAAYQKMAEIPYNFTDRRVSVIVSNNSTTTLITKGAVSNVLEQCTMAEIAGQSQPIAELKDQIQATFKQLGEQGYRVLALATKENPQQVDSVYQDTDLTFIGFIVLNDPLKSDAKDTIQAIHDLNVDLKVITGDNRYVARTVAAQLNLPVDQIMTGTELAALTDVDLVHRVRDISVFAEIEPSQKDQVILALQKAGCVVGYMGDGINDAPAIRSADIGISVNTAADVAKDAADFVLLEQDLKVLMSGIIQGRKTFSNTMKYVRMATSANFGNMFSMAGASVFLPFLPLLPTQVLLTNLITDFPEMQIAGDNVADSELAVPKKWDIKFIRRFMIIFGLLSSIFDYLTFGILWGWLGASESLFQTGWFTESILSASLMVLVLRTEQSIFKSRPAKGLVIATLASCLVTLVLPYTPVGPLLHFVPLTGEIYIAIALLVLAYLTLGEILKQWFYKQH